MRCSINRGALLHGLYYVGVIGKSLFMSSSSFLATSVQRNISCPAVQMVFFRPNYAGNCSCLQNAGTIMLPSPCAKSGSTSWKSMATR